MVSPETPHEPYGGPDGLKRFVDAAHARGLGVVLDVVYNHFGPSGAYAPMFAPYLSKHGANPWGEAATTLEWTLSSPPPFHQFNDLPHITSEAH